MSKESNTMSKKKVELVYVIRTVHIPLTESELESRKSELPLVISQEDRLAIRRKDILSELKAESDDLADKKSKLVKEINEKKRVEDLRCPKIGVVSERCWQILHPTTGEILERIPMTYGEVEHLSQIEMPLEQDEEEVPNSNDEKSDEDDGGGSFRLLALPEPPPVPPVGEELPALEVIEGEIVAEPAARYIDEAGNSPLRIIIPSGAGALGRNKDWESTLTQGNFLWGHMNAAKEGLVPPAQVGTVLAPLWHNGVMYAIAYYWSGGGLGPARKWGWPMVPIEHYKGQPLGKDLPDPHGDTDFWVEKPEHCPKVVEGCGNYNFEGAVVRWEEAVYVLSAPYVELISSEDAQRFGVVGEPLNWTGPEGVDWDRPKKRGKRTVAPEVVLDKVPDLSLDITPARSATDQANDFAAQLVGGGK